jgi:hypothetical protein
LMSYVPLYDRSRPAQFPGMRALFTRDDNKPQRLFAAYFLRRPKRPFMRRKQ